MPETPNHSADTPRIWDDTLALRMIKHDFAINAQAIFEFEQLIESL